jgi:hypothetical protein
MPVPVEPESAHFESVCQASFFETYNLSRVGRLSGSVLMEIGQLARSYLRLGRYIASYPSLF